VPYLYVNGDRLFYEEAGDGRAVVLVHGGLGDLRMWDGVVPLLAASHRVVRFDVRGFGRSDAPAGEFSPHDDLRALLDGLGIESAALVGLSLGGRIVLDAALELPERVSALVLVAPGVNGLPLEGVYTEEQDREFGEALAGGDLERAATIDLSVWAPLGTDERIKALLLDNLRENKGVVMVPAKPPAGERLEDVRVPTLVVIGTRDLPRMLELADELVSRIPNTRRAELESDHYLPMREPQAFAQCVREFLG
jgi:3-oxoadipate enol-lactonase